MTIYLVRHGETAFNRDGQALGRADVPLTALGIAQAEAVSRRLAAAEVVRVVSSPLVRALTVASMVGDRHGLRPEPLDALTELDVGETEGLGLSTMRERFPAFLRRWASDDGWLARMPGGESIEDLGIRLKPLSDDLLVAANGDVVVVSHNFTLRVLVCQLLGLSPSRFRSIEFGLAAITSLEIRGGRAAVRGINDACHVANLNLA